LAQVAQATRLLFAAATADVVVRLVAVARSYWPRANYSGPAFDDRRRAPTNAPLCVNSLRAALAVVQDARPPAAEAVAALAHDLLRRMAMHLVAEGERRLAEFDRAQHYSPPQRGKGKRNRSKRNKRNKASR